MNTSAPCSVVFVQVEYSQVSLCTNVQLVKDGADSFVCPVLGQAFPITGFTLLLIEGPGDLAGLSNISSSCSIFFLLSC